MVCINYCTSSGVRVLSERGAPRSLEGDTEIRKLQAVDSRQCMRKCTVLNNEHMSTLSHPIDSFWALWMAPSERRILIRERLHVGTGTNARKRRIQRRLPYTAAMSTDSLESLNDDIDSDIFSDEVRIAQEEWDESVTQLQLLISVVMLPVLGKWLGRRWSQWGT